MIPLIGYGHRLSVRPGEKQPVHGEGLPVGVAAAKGRGGSGEDIEGQLNNPGKLISSRHLVSPGHLISPGRA